MTLSHLSPDQAQRQKEFRHFAQQAIAPHAGASDADQAMPRSVIRALAEAGYIGALLPASRGGRGMTIVDYGLLTEEIGRTCQSARNLVAVLDMVARAIDRWGTAAQRERWLPGILDGSSIAAFALTEPEVGSDAAAIQTTATRDGDDVLLTGVKKWISFGQLAGLYLVFAQYDGGPTGFLLPRHTAGLQVSPIKGLLGLRGSMLGKLTIDHCRVPLSNMIGRPGSGIAFVASDALDLGRYSTAWGSVGLAQECLNVAASHAAQRVQYGTQIVNHQLIQELLADVAIDTMAARLLCHHAGVSKERGDRDAVHQTLMAKCHASRTAVKAAASSVQILGARGISAESPAERFYRDAKIMEIIEGTTQIQHGLIGQYVAQTAQR